MARFFTIRAMTPPGGPRTCLHICFAAFLTATLAAGVGFPLAPALAGDARILGHLPKLRPETPVPADPNMLGYIQLSDSADTLVYVANLTAGGELDRGAPVRVYWRRYSGGGKGRRDGLSFMERNVAFGVTSKALPGPRPEFKSNFAIYPQRTAIVRVNKKGRAEAITELGGRKTRLIYGYINLDTSGLIPKVFYVDVFGRDLETGKIVHERLPFNEPVKSGG